MCRTPYWYGSFLAGTLLSSQARRRDFVPGGAEKNLIIPTIVINANIYMVCDDILWNFNTRRTTFSEIYLKDR